MCKKLVMALLLTLLREHNSFCALIWKNVSTWWEKILIQAHIRSPNFLSKFNTVYTLHLGLNLLRLCLFHCLVYYALWQNFTNSATVASCTRPLGCPNTRYLVSLSNCLSFSSCDPLPAGSKDSAIKCSMHIGLQPILVIWWGQSFLKTRSFWNSFRLTNLHWI